MGLTGLIGPLLFSYVLSWAIGAGKGYGVPGAAYLLAAALLAIGVALAAGVHVVPARRPESAG